MGAKHRRRETAIEGIYTDYMPRDEKYCHYCVAPEGLPAFNKLIGRKIVQEEPMSAPGSASGFRFGDSATWKVTQQLTASTNCRQHDHMSDKAGVFEAKGVFVCQRTSGSTRLGEEAILKVFIQLPPLDQDTGEIDHNFLPNPDDPDFDEHSAFWQEADALMTLTEGRCPVTPTLYYLQQFLGRESDPLPGGYYKYILMEKLPGTNLLKFWSFSYEERESVREAFRAAYPHLRMFYSHGDEASRNLVWDRQTQKLYFIDFEEVWPSNKTFEQCRDVADIIMVAWGILGLDIDRRPVR